MKHMMLILALLFTAAPAWAKKSENPLVKQVSRLRFEVSRSAAEKELGDGVGQLRTFSAIPSFADGPFSGVRVSSFSAKCLLPRFGVKEGDVISAIQGIPLHMPGDIYDIADRLEKSKPGSVVRVDIKRDGSDITQNYLVVE
jgi:S1-C subfamily serine protease